MNKLGGALDDAARNHHLVHSAALIAEGLTYNQISSLVRARVLERIRNGIFRIPGTRTPIQDLAAALSCHTGAVGSHTTCLFVHGLAVDPPDDPHFTLPPTATGRTTLGVLHRSPLDPVDITRRHGLPVTTLARALVDSSELVSARRLGELIDEAVTARKTTIERILDAAYRAERAPGRIGVGRLRQALEPWLEPIQPDSPAEAAAIRRIQSFGLPSPATQYEIVDHEGAFVARVDMAWPSQRVLREYDSPRYHGPGRTEADEIRLQRLEALGWSVGSIQRQHLRPGEVAWLEDLAADLRRSRDSAA